MTASVTIVFFLKCRNYLPRVRHMLWLMKMVFRWPFCPFDEVVIPINPPHFTHSINFPFLCIIFHCRHRHRDSIFSGVTSFKKLNQEIVYAKNISLAVLVRMLAHNFFPKLKMSLPIVSETRFAWVSSGLSQLNEVSPFKLFRDMVRFVFFSFICYYVAHNLSWSFCSSCSFVILSCAAGIHPPARDVVRDI